MFLCVSEADFDPIRPHMLPTFCLYVHVLSRVIRLHLRVPPKLGTIYTPCIHFACSRTDWCVLNRNTPPCFCIFTMGAVMLFACIRVAAVIPSDGSCACVSFRGPRPRGTGVLPGWLQCGFHEGEVLHLSPLPHISFLSEDKHQSLLNHEAPFGDL